MAEDPAEVLKRNRALLRAYKETAESEQLLEKLPQGHGSGLNADMVDGLHAAEIIARAPGKGGGGGGSGSGSGDMTKTVYDQNENGIVDNSEKLEGSTKAQVQDHAPQAHTLASHTTKAHTELTEVNADQHNDTKVRSKVVDESAIADDKILVYKVASDTLVYEAKPSGGGSHNILSATHPDTLPASVTIGDLIIGNATPKWARLAVGASNKVLKVLSGLPAWGDVDWAELTGKPSTFAPSIHQHSAASSDGGDDLRPNIIGKYATPAAVYLYLRTRDGDENPVHNIFAPLDHGWGYLGATAKRWRGIYALYCTLTNDLVVSGLAVVTGTIDTVNGGFRSGGNLTHFFPNAASAHDTLRPFTADYSYLGTASYYFNSVYADHVKYKEHSAFDALDDIGLLRRMKAHPTNKTKKGLPSIDYSTVPDELKAYEPEDIVDAKGKIQQAKGYHDFMDLGALCGLLTGAVKQLADKVDELNAKVAKLEKGG